MTPYRGVDGPIAVLLCPGRGSYGREQLGCLARTLEPDGEVAAALAAADAARRAAGEPTLRELDAADRFRPSWHQEGRNAAELIYFCTMAHVERLRQRYAIAAVAGNSLGWYTALAAAGALSVADGWTLVRTMARLQAEVAGGQVLTTCVDESWRVDHSARREVARVLEAICARGVDWLVWPSIHLGGHEVLAGTEAGVAALMQQLPARRLGRREFPFVLAGHGPFHTPLCAPVAERAQIELADLPIAAPAVHLIDGRGDVASPWSADPAQLLHYTTTAQILETFDFTAAVRCGLREFCPDVLLCAGPGDSLSAPSGHVVLAEGYRRILARDALAAARLVRTD